jgi:hypothetical protein
MPVIARDAVASDHLVYAWPFPIGPEEQEVACAEDEQVVMCPSWVVGDRLGPGRHRWRTSDPMRPVSAFFVLTAPVEVSFDMTTSFTIPATGQPVRLRASGSLQVRCSDPALLIAQFVGLPFDHVNEGIVRSVSRSVERMLARLLTRRAVLAGTPAAVTDLAMLPNIVEELVAYNPAAGAVFGVELVRMGHLSTYADDGSRPWPALGGNANGETARVIPPHQQFGNPPSRPDIPMLETVRQIPRAHSTPPSEALHKQTQQTPIPPPPRAMSPAMHDVSGEIPRLPPPPPAGRAMSPQIPGQRPVEMPRSVDEITQPGLQVVRTPVPGSLRAVSPPAAVEEVRGAILGIGTGHIGHASSTVSGEIPTKIPPGARVLVPGPNGLMQSATVRQLLQGYYELEVGSSGETIWVPMNGVVPE